MIEKKCYCGSPKTFQDCCEPYIKGIQKAPSAEALMRSRYSAYVTHAADYLVATTQLSKRKFHSKKEILDWACCNTWLRLEIISTTGNVVEFKAYYFEIQREINSLPPVHIHHEKSTFRFENGSWFYMWMGYFIDYFKLIPSLFWFFLFFYNAFGEDFFHPKLY